jgi:hypothetical protein
VRPRPRLFWGHLTCVGFAVRPGGVNVAPGEGRVYSANSEQYNEPSGYVQGTNRTTMVRHLINSRFCWRVRVYEIESLWLKWERKSRLFRRTISMMECVA